MGSRPPIKSFEGKLHGNDTFSVPAIVREKNHWTDDFITGAQLSKQIEQEYAYLKTMLIDLGLAK